ncbi:MAG: hypothetical protein FVQ78_06655 [Solirubrobacterales bacterium]|nr:hypothetical protein [Solirubrobacterales bacterium]
MKELLKPWLGGTNPQSLERVAARFVLAHNLVQAIPWLFGLVGAIAAGAYGAASSSHLLVAIAVGFATSCSLVLGISLASWYIAARKVGWRQISENKDKELAERDLDAEDVTKFQLPLQLILDLSTHPLVIRNPLNADELCDQWLRRYVANNLATLAPGIQIGVLNRTAGHLRVACEGNLPGVFDRMLPKPTPRDFSECLAEIAPNAKRLLLFEDERASVAEWLIVIPEGELDLGAKAFIGFARQALAAARRALLVIRSTGVDGDDDGVAMPRA